MDHEAGKHFFFLISTLFIRGGERMAYRLNTRIGLPGSLSPRLGKIDLGQHELISRDLH